MWPSMKRELRIVRAFLGFAHADLGRRLLPTLCAEDAAGGEDKTSGSPTGGFALALAFPPARMVQQPFLRHESTGQALGVHGQNVLGGSVHKGTVPVTILPFELFGNAVPWFNLMARQWR